MPFLPRRHSRPGLPGFTLIEIIVAVAIVSILAVLLLGARNAAVAGGRKAKGISNLRQVGLGIQFYTAENNGSLPGPCTFGTLPNYNWNAIPLGSLAGYIAPYMGYPDLRANNDYSSYKTFTPLVSPGLAAWNPKSVQTNSGLPHYIQNNTLTSEGLTYRVLGSITTPWIQPPLKMMDLSTFGGPSKVWILSDVDQAMTNSLVTASGWWANLPPRPVYGSLRLRLYADGHVLGVATNEP